MIVVVRTDKGEVVWCSEEDFTYADILLADVRVPNRRGGSFYGGLKRAIRDAEEIDAGRDPERPSEKAMRLAHEPGSLPSCPECGGLVEHVVGCPQMDVAH